MVAFAILRKALKIEKNNPFKRALKYFFLVKKMWTKMTLGWPHCG
jgi:hypothetical protein